MVSELESDWRVGLMFPFVMLFSSCSFVVAHCTKSQAAMLFLDADPMPSDHSQMFEALPSGPAGGGACPTVAATLLDSGSSKVSAMWSASMKNAALPAAKWFIASYQVNVPTLSGE